MTSQENNPIWGFEKKEKQAQVRGLWTIFVYFLKAHKDQDFEGVTCRRPSPALGDRLPVAQGQHSGRLTKNTLTATLALAIHTTWSHFHSKENQGTLPVWGKEHPGLLQLVL